MFANSDVKVLRFLSEALDDQRFGPLALAIVHYSIPRATCSWGPIVLSGDEGQRSTFS
jgi:hypothetical protein